MKYLCVLSFLLFLTATTWAGSRVAIILSEDNKVYQTIADSCAEKIKDAFPGIDIRQIVMDNKKDDRKAILDFYPDVNFAIGGQAAKLCDSLTVFPFVYTMVLNPVATKLTDASGKAKGFSTGIEVIIDPLSQFEVLKSQIPGTKSIGILFSKKSYNYVNKGLAAAESLGMKLISEEVENIDNVSKHFRQLLKNDIDTYWLILDTNILSTDTLNYFIEGCNVREINLLTFNPNHLKDGASIAVFLDYPGLGRQASEIMTRILKGESADKIPSTEAKYTAFRINEKNIFRKK